MTEKWYHRELSFRQGGWWICALKRSTWLVFHCLVPSLCPDTCMCFFLKPQAGTAAGAKQGLARFRWRKWFAVKIGLNIKSHFSDYLLNHRRRGHVLLINFQVHNAKTASCTAVAIADKAKVEVLVPSCAEHVSIHLLKIYFCTKQSGEELCSIKSIGLSKWFPE